MATTFNAWQAGDGVKSEERAGQVKICDGRE